MRLGCGVEEGVAQGTGRACIRLVKWYLNLVSAQKIGKLVIFIARWKRTLWFFCLTPLKSHCQEVFKTPLTLMKTTTLAHLVGVQSFRIFKSWPNCTLFIKFSQILKIPKLWTPTKCAKIIALIKVRGVLKTSWQWLLSCVKQKIHTVLYHCAVKASSWPVFPFLGGPQVGVPPKTPKNIFFNFFCKISTPPNLNFTDLR